KSRVTKLIREKKVVLILKRGRPVGYFVPWDEACAGEPLKKAALETLMTALAKEREAKGVSEEVVADAEREARAKAVQETRGVLGPEDAPEWTETSGAEWVRKVRKEGDRSTPWAM
ncbi:hypothetical protein, partial [Ammonifex thiophilus]|uniref:hypothetical protein n=1 Tax=Ammonifex thiophilus TaxID=444093 RepID=UPI00196A45F5